MTIALVTLPVLTDNYIYLVHDHQSGETAVVDVGDCDAVLLALAEHDWTLTEIWLTHHHSDHIDGTEALVSATGAKVTGAAADKHRLPHLDREVAEGDSFTFAGHEVRVLEVPGHTVGHIAFYMPDLKAAFTGDSLMSLGCGRLFEGTPQQMWNSLSKIAELPDETLICSGHEYTLSNGKFARTIDQSNPALKERIAEAEALRAEGKPTVPRRLAEEKATNPFLRARSPSIRAHLGLGASSDVEVFAEIRRRKDKF